MSPPSASPSGRNLALKPYGSTFEANEAAGKVVRGKFGVSEARLGVVLIRLNSPPLSAGLIKDLFVYCLLQLVIRVLRTPRPR